MCCVFMLRLFECVLAFCFGGGEFFVCLGYLVVVKWVCVRPLVVRVSLYVFTSWVLISCMIARFLRFLV